MKAKHINQYVDDSLSRKLLFSPLDTPLLEKRLIEVYRASRTALEEGGANTLFLAIGFLEWKESERFKALLKRHYYLFLCRSPVIPLKQVIACICMMMSLALIHFITIIKTGF